MGTELTYGAWWVAAASRSCGVRERESSAPLAAALSHMGACARASGGAVALHPLQLRPPAWGAKRRQDFKMSRRAPVAPLGTNHPTMRAPRETWDSDVPEADPPGGWPDNVPQAAGALPASAPALPTRRASAAGDLGSIPGPSAPNESPTRSNQHVRHGLAVAGQLQSRSFSGGPGGWPEQPPQAATGPGDSLARERPSHDDTCTETHDQGVGSAGRPSAPPSKEPGHPMAHARSAPALNTVASGDAAATVAGQSWTASPAAAPTAPSQPSGAAPLPTDLVGTAAVGVPVLLLPQPGAVAFTLGPAGMPAPHAYPLNGGEPLTHPQPGEDDVDVVATIGAGGAVSVVRRRRGTSGGGDATGDEGGDEPEDGPCALSSDVRRRLQRVLGRQRMKRVRTWKDLSHSLAAPRPAFPMLFTAAMVATLLGGFLFMAGQHGAYAQAELVAAGKDAPPLAWGPATLGPWLVFWRTTATHSFDFDVRWAGRGSPACKCTCDSWWVASSRVRADVCEPASLPGIPAVPPRLGRAVRPPPGSRPVVALAELAAAAPEPRAPGLQPGPHAGALHLPRGAVRRVDGDARMAGGGRGGWLLLGAAGEPLQARGR